MWSPGLLKSMSAFLRVFFVSAYMHPKAPSPGGSPRPHFRAFGKGSQQPSSDTHLSSTFGGSWGQKPFPQLRHTKRINLLSAILSEIGYYNLTVDWNLTPFNFTEPGRGAVSRPLLPFALLCLLHDQRWWNNFWIPSLFQDLEVAFVLGWLRLSYVASERKIKLEFFFPKTYSTGGAIFYRVRLSVVPGASGPLPGKSSWKMRFCLCFHIRLSHLRLSPNRFWKMPCSNMLD